MDFLQVCEFFGGTLFYEELRGSLREIPDRIDDFEKSPKNQSTDGRAATILLRVVYHLQLGHIKTAHQLLASLISDKQYSFRWKFRAHTYAILYQTWKHSPPTFRAFSPLRGPSMVVREITHNLLDLRAILQVCENLKQYAETVDLLEFNLIHELWHVSIQGLEMARSLNPAYEYFIVLEPSVIGAYKADLDGCKQRLAQAQHDCITCNLPLVSAYVDRLLYELSYSEGLDDATQYLDDMRKKYDSNRDIHGLGLCELIREDALVSSPFTSPLIFNLHLADSWDDFGGNSDMYQRSDSLQGPFPGSDPRVLEQVTIDTDGTLRSLSDHSPSQVTDEYVKVLDKVHRRYQVAETHFIGAASPRALAAILLRRASILRMHSLSPSWSWNPERACKDEESRLLTAACEAFEACFDEQNRMIVQIHTFLREGIADDNSDIGRSIRMSTNQSENQVFVAHLGLLALRLGHYFRFICGQSALSNQKYENARVIFHDLNGFRVAWFQVWLARVSLFVSLHDYRSAKLPIEEVKNAFGPMFKEILEKGAKTRQISEIHRIVGISMHFGRKVGEAVLTVYPNLLGASTILESEVEKIFTVLLSMDSEKWYISSLGPWIAQQRQRLRYLATISKCKRYEQEGDLMAAQSVLTAYMNSSPHESGNDLAAKIYRINVSLSCGDLEEPEKVLACIADGETFPQHLPPDLDWLPRQQHLVSLQATEIIFVACIQAGSWERAELLTETLEQLSPGYFTSVSGYTHIGPWQRCFYAGLVAEHHGQTQLAMYFYMQSRHFLEITRWNLATPYERRALASHPDFGRLTNSIARATLQEMENHGQMESTRRPKAFSMDRRVFTIFKSQIANYSTIDRADRAAEAFEVLEWNRAMTLLEGIGIPDSPESNVLSLKYRHEAWIELQSLARPMNAEEWSEFMELHNEFGGKEVHFRRNTKPPLIRLPQLLLAIPPNALVVYTSLSTDGLLLYALDRSGIKHASRNPQLTDPIIRVYILAYWNLVTRDNGHNKCEVTYETIQILSVLLLGPIARYIQAKEHIIFVPSSDLVRLPFQALVYEGRPLGLQKSVSQVPNLSFLYHLRRRDRSAKIAKIAPIARPGSLREELDGGEAALPMAAIETLLISQIFDTTPLRAETISRNDFQEHLKTSSMIHLATHGYFNVDSPLQSYISLKERFRVLDILAVQTNVELVIFSACLSGLGQPSDGGDLLGFSHALLAAGANAFVGALWKTNDVVTLIHMNLFYTQLLKCTDTPATLAEVWRRATVLLYYLDVEGAVSRLRAFVEFWAALEKRGLEPNTFVRGGRRRLEEAIKNLEGEPGRSMIDFKHPFFWAPFVMVGNAGLEIQISLREASLPTGNPTD